MLVGVDVSQERMVLGVLERAYFVQYPWGPFIQLADVVALQGELVLCGARACSHAQILGSLHE